jgi:hypothetical protein
VRFRARVGIWDLVTVAIIVATRWIVYALAPQSVLLDALAHQEGSPDLTGALVGIMLVAAGIACAVLWVAVVAVRERVALEGRRLVETPRLALGPLGARFLALFVVSSFLFAMTESTIHWRDGLGWHGLGCLLGPIHRDAIPILAALSLLAVAVHGAIAHLLAWARRLFAQLAARPLVLGSTTPPSCFSETPRRRRAWARAAARGPPALGVPVPSF